VGEKEREREKLKIQKLSLYYLAPIFEDLIQLKFNWMRSKNINLEKLKFLVKRVPGT
jgi:hypothetical protein